jgi:hypothetical protein
MILSPPRFSMTDYALNCRKLAAQPAFEGIHRLVHGTDRQHRIHMTVKIDDFTGGRFPYPHIMNLTERRKLGRERGEEFANFADAERCGIAASQ